MNVRATADDLRKSGSFAEAASAYATIWPDGDPRTGWGYAICLRKLGEPQRAVEVAQQVTALAPDFLLGRSVYAWALYDTIRDADELTPDLLSRAEMIVRLTRDAPNAYSAVCPFVTTILKVGRLLTKKGRYAHVLRWLEHLDPDQLRKDEFPFIDPHGKPRKLASQRERYHSLKTHSLEKLEQWEACLAAAQLALTACSPLHHDNDIWFARRVARSKIHLGEYGEGVSLLETLAKRKPTSFIFFDIAEAAWKSENFATAATNCRLALRSPGEIGFKLDALLLLSRLLWRDGKEEEARSHLCLYIVYRAERNWKISPEVNALALEWGISPASNDARTLLKQLQQSWRDASSVDGARKPGTVQTLFPHGKAGFIVSDDNERFYFESRDWKEKRRDLAQGVHVTFRTRSSFDRKRNKPTVVACDILGS